MTDIDPRDLRSFPVGPYDQALREALQNPSRLQYTYRPDLDQDDWGGLKRYHYDVNAVGAPATHEALKYDRLRRFAYDPELVTPRDEGEDAQFRTQFDWKGHPEWRREMYRDLDDPTRNTAGFTDEVQARPGHLYRGMSHEEYEQAKQRGYFDSDRSYNLGEEGTLFSTDPSQARAYATGFSPWHRNPGYAAPGYVIEVPRPEDAYPHPNQSADTTEIVAPSPIPFDQVQRAWQFKPYATLLEDMQLRSENNGQTWTGRPRFDNYYAYRPMPDLTPRQASVKKTSDKLHDFLMNPKSRPDLQTPGAQYFLRALEAHHSEKRDPLMPWLAREWKQGRLRPSGDLAYQLQNHSLGRALPDEIKQALQAHDRGKPYQPMPDVDMPGLYSGLMNAIAPGLRDVSNPNPHDPEGLWPEHRLGDRLLDHWADFLNSNHPTRRAMGDIMQHPLPAFRQHVQNWDEAMQQEAQQRALEGGKVVHTTPDGWTVRQLTTPEELKGEGEVMGHCVGGYHDLVRNGESMIYSLRDPKGFPHVTTEIQPTQYERQDSLGTHRTDARHYVNNEQVTYPIPHGGNVVQIQGKGNEEPIPEYKARMKNWFDTFAPEDKPQWAGPQWDEDYITQPGQIEPRHFAQYDEYGLRRHPSADYDELLENTTSPGPTWSNGRYEPAWGQNIYDLAKAHGQIPALGQALTGYSQRQQEKFDDWRDQNYEQTVPYPAEADEDSPEMQAYYEDEREWMQEHPGMMASQDMWEKLRPHWNPETQTFENEPYQPQAPAQVTSSAWPDL